MFKASGRAVTQAALVVAITATGLAAWADDDQDNTSGRLYGWTVTGPSGEAKDLLGSETLRVVEAASGNFFASGELKLKKGPKGGKAHKKSHLQRDAAGKLLKYQRVEAGLKGPGLRLFEWQGQMRVAPINDSGKPVDVGALTSARIWEDGLWHLYHTWGLPKQCETARLSYFAPAKRASGEATLRCVGARKIWDEQKKPIEVNRFEVGGVDGEAVELWVDAKGGLIGGRSESRVMLRQKYTLDPGKDVDRADEPGDEEPDKDAIKDRGVGE